MIKPFERVLGLEGSCNLRDLGGYPAADGRAVKSGVLYRSGVMAYFTDADRRSIAELGIQTICDLRRSDERDNEPTAWPETAVNIRFWDDEPEFVGQGGLSWRDVSSADQAKQIMIEFYRGMPAWLEHRLRGVFNFLMAEEVPLLFHCSGGKDRTGLTAALVLHSLGVDRDTILGDYEMTNHAVDMEQFMQRNNKAAMGLTDAEHPILKMPADVRKVMVKADPDFLLAAFSQIESDHGSVDDFLQQRFGVTPLVRDQLRQNLLSE